MTSKRSGDLGVTVKTKPYGEVEISEKQILSFPEGILGFDYIRKFILLDTDNEEFDRTDCLLL